VKESLKGLTGGGNDKGVVDTVKDLAGGGGEGQSFKDLSGMLSYPDACIRLASPSPDAGIHTWPHQLVACAFVNPSQSPHV
jgi:hypothetical protein